MPAGYLCRNLANAARGANRLYEWNEAIQKMIDWIEENICMEPSLLQMADHIGYSPCYCSTRFHDVTGMTIRKYVSGRRLALAALSLRDTDERIIDIAVRYGYSSQEALTRAFRTAFGCTPTSYRRNPIPIPLPIRLVVYTPEHYRNLHTQHQKGEITMSKNVLAQVHVRTEFIPAHKYLGIWDANARDYGEFWKSHNCDTVCGIIDSLSNACDPIITGHTAGWYYAGGERRYFYGTGMPLDYNGKIPEGFEMREFPASYYLVFFHPAFDYLKDNNEVMRKVEELSWNYDIEKESGGRYAWNEDACQCYQRHYPEVLGYQILRPVRKISTN